MTGCQPTACIPTACLWPLNHGAFVAGQVYCLSAVDGKTISPLGGLDAVDGKSFFLNAVNEDCSGND